LERAHLVTPNERAMMAGVRILSQLVKLGAAVHPLRHPVWMFVKRHRSTVRGRFYS
jgi:hypothetical protein